MNPIRPGVYTSYTLISSNTGMSGVTIGLAAAGPAVHGMQCIRSFQQAKAVFGESDTSLLQSLKAIFAHARTEVYAISVPSGDYEAAHTALLQKPVSVLCTDCTDQSVLTVLATDLRLRAESGQAVIGIAGAETASAAKTLAKALNCERFCLAAPAVSFGTAAVNVGPAVLAGMIARTDDYTDNLNGATAEIPYTVSTAFSDDTLRELMDAGICLFQQSGSVAELLRGMTTKTTDSSGNPDRRFHNLSVTLIADRVVSDVRTLLTQKLLGSGNGQVTLDAVLALIVCTLEEYRISGALTAYDTPLIELDEQDRTLCHVSLSFTVRQGIYQVYLHAMVNV